MRVFLVSFLLALVSCASAQSVYQGHVLFRTFFNSSVANTETPFEGTATLVQTINGNVSTTTVTLNVRGLQSNKTYGVHVHTWGDLSGSFNHNVFPLTMFHNASTVGTVGGHFDVAGRGAPAHNCAPHANRHTGDLGNITVATTTAPTDLVSYTLTSELLDLGLDASNGNSIIGRAVVIHELVDGCVQVNVSLGAWVAVGVIGIDNVQNNTASQDALIPLDPANFAPKADAVIYNGANIVGNVWFWSDPNGVVHTTGIVSGFDPNTEHAFVIHQYGNIINEANIGGIFAGNTTTHAIPPTQTRHWGILGNLKADANGIITFTDITAGLELISLADVSKHSIIGRTIAFHDNAITGTEGSAGATTRWGVIGLASPTAVAPVFEPSVNSVPALGHAILHPYFNSSNANISALKGTVDFQQSALGGEVTVIIKVSGLQANKVYGVHIHSWGDLLGAINTNNWPLSINHTVGTVGTVGGHFDVAGRGAPAHNCAPHANRHTGDLGNITVAAATGINDVVTYTLSSELLDLGIRSDFLNDSIIGRAVVIHELPDNCVQVNVSLGNWVAVGVIGLHNTPGNAAKQDTLPTNTKANVLVLDATNKVPLGDLQLSTDNGVIRAYGVVGGFAPNTIHAIHVHVWGNEDQAGTSGPHYSQYLADFGHSLPPSTSRHWGDLGNVTANEQGLVFFNNLDINANLLSLWNRTAHGIIGRTLTFHASADDGTTTGATAYGGRVAYGVIGLANPATVFPAIPFPQPPTDQPTTTPAPSTGTGTNTTNPPGTTTPPTTNGTGTTAPPTITTQPPTTNVTTAPPTATPPSAATHNQANVLIMLIAMVMVIASMLVVA